MVLTRVQNQDMSPEDLERIHQIHDQTYGRGQIGKAWSEFQEDFFGDYYGLEKATQLLTLDSDRIVGYSIETQRVTAQDVQWAKIIEHAADPSGSLKRGAVFTMLMEELAEHASEEDFYYFSEVGVDKERVITLYDKAGFRPLADEELMGGLLENTLVGKEFELAEYQGVPVVSRSTRKVANTLMYVMSNFRCENV